MRDRIKLSAWRDEMPDEEPCTQYRSADIANARRNIERYPWAREIVEGWKIQVRDAMQRDRAFFEEIIPDLTPWSAFAAACTVCVNKKSSMGEDGIWVWAVNQPDAIRCHYCDAVYPHPDYPETGRLVCPKMGQTFSYYETDEERAHPEDRSGTHALWWCPVAGAHLLEWADPILQKSPGPPTTSCRWQSSTP